MQASGERGATNSEATKKASMILQGERGIPGLNDGTIFPRSHYTQPLPSWLWAMRRLKGSRFVVPSDVSNGAIAIAGEVVGPFTLPNKLSHYANKHAGHGWPEPNSQTMANDAFEAAISSTDLKQYDNDGNDYVDAFVVVHASKGAEETGDLEDIWNVKWTLPTPREAHGVKVYGFLSAPEDAKCDVCAHELGHLVFGWPDLWDSSHNSSGIRNWWWCQTRCKASQGWIETVTEMENHQITLEDVKRGHKTHRLWTNGEETSKEYFLIEHRQLTGFDEYLPASGLLIWHIDEAAYSNIDPLHPKIKLIQANNLNLIKTSGSCGNAGDAYPASTKSTFNSTLSPPSKAYSGKDTFVSITNIPAPSPSMTFAITVTRIDPTLMRCTTFWYTASRMRTSPKPTASTATTQANSSSSSPTATMIMPWGDGTWYFQNAQSGQFRNLDTREDGDGVVMAPADAGRATQRWRVEAIRGITEEGFHGRGLTVGRSVALI
ncbi:M6 metalloprotease [Clathrospora elynae]|uniref:M6 metalloprotease n=1 Tax=Clathrospora elynae TaxID=706981 RepID=A0A6A5S8C1_9PLEO|nr:M6 metalloprotease [Clathrospora elynae]